MPKLLRHTQTVTVPKLALPCDEVWQAADQAQREEADSHGGAQDVHAEILLRMHDEDGTLVLQNPAHQFVACLKPGIVQAHGWRLPYRRDRATLKAHLAPAPASGVRLHLMFIDLVFYTPSCYISPLLALHAEHVANHDLRDDAVL